MCPKSNIKFKAFTRSDLFLSLNLFLDYCRDALFNLDNKYRNNIRKIIEQANLCTASNVSFQILYVDKKWQHVKDINSELECYLDVLVRH